MDKSTLLAPRLPTGEVEIPDVGTVTVQGLSRAVLMEVQRIAAGDPAVAEAKILGAAMVDPKLTENEVQQWQAASSAGEIELVVEKVRVLSGISDDAVKAAYADFRGQS